LRSVLGGVPFMDEIFERGQDKQAMILRLIEETVRDEIERLHRLWKRGKKTDGTDGVLRPLFDEAALGRLDLFDRIQLADVISVRRATRSLSEAGRRLFSASMQEKASRNDADRLKKYLARFGLEWRQAREPQQGSGRIDP
jgi:transcriptional regulatory protein RtcR